MGAFGRPVRLSVCAIGLALGAAAQAGAGAWTRPAGEGLLIGTTAHRVAPVSALTGGPVDDDTNISQLYLEYGLIEGLTVGAKVYVEFSTTDFDGNSASAGGFLRKRLWQDGHGGVASVEGGYAHPIESMIGNGFEEIAEPGAVPEAYLAGLYGRGWAGDWGNAFVSTGAAYQWRGDGVADELRYEVTAGYAPWRRWMGILSFYGLYPLAEGTDASLKIAPSIAYTMWPRAGEEDEEPGKPVHPRTIQLGISYDLLNGGDGLGVSLSLWQPF